MNGVPQQVTGNDVGVAPVASSGASQIRLLIAEDEANLGAILEQFMVARGFAVTMVRDGRAALERLRSDRFYVALMDIVMPEMDGLEVLRQLRADPLPPEIIVITGNGTTDTALMAMKLGAYDFLSKPYRMAEVEALVRRAWEKRVLTRKNLALTAQLDRVEPPIIIDTHFAPLRAVLALVDRIAPTDSPVLISGEQGTGKESMARYIHARSARAHDPFVTVDSSIDLTSSSVSAAANNGGADDIASLPALVDVAASGTIYLHRVETLSRDAQRLVLDALVRGVIPHAGGTRMIPWHARIVASTTQDEATMSNSLDPDLLRLLSTVRIELPPLRERLVDLRLLGDRLLSRCAGRSKLSAAALELLEQYSWPGNVSELRLVLERASMLAHGELIEPRHLGAPVAPDDSATTESTDSLDLEGLERRHIAQVLERTGWHQGKAATMLGISPKTLYRKIREYGFHRPGSRRE